MNTNGFSDWRTPSSRRQAIIMRRPLGRCAPVAAPPDSCEFVSIRGSNPAARLICQRLADGVEDLPVGREKDEALPGDDLFADQHGELAESALDQSGLHLELAFQQGRHTDEIGRASCRERVKIAV